MNAYERLRAMVAGRPVDRPGVTAWRHFFLEDRNVADNVKRHVAFQEQNSWDLIKVMANGVHIQEQFGADITWSRHADEFPVTNRRFLNSPKAFRSLRPAGVESGALAREAEVARRLVDRYQGRVPVLATVFSPATCALELYCGWQNPWPFAELARDYGDDLEAAMPALTETTARLVEAYVAAGVDGIFFASQVMNDTLLTPELYERFGTPWDLAALAPARGRTWFNMLHVHGQGHLFFDAAGRYPVEALNWEDLGSDVSLADAAARFPGKVLVGGIDRTGDFRETDRDALARRMAQRVKAAAGAVPSGRLIIAPGCALDTAIPEYRYNTLKEAVETVFGIGRD